MLRDDEADDERFAEADDEEREAEELLVEELEVLRCWLELVLEEDLAARVCALRSAEPATIAIATSPAEM